MPDRISFTRPAVERIARVVRAVEGARPAGEGLRSRAVVSGGKDKPFRVATFTGAWGTNTVKVVTFKYQTNTPNTASVTNLIYDLPSRGTLNCHIAKEGTAYYLIAAQESTANIGVKRGTFSPPWAKGATKTVPDAVNAGETYSGVRNYFADIAGSGTKACAIAYVGNEWILIAAEC